MIENTDDAYGFPPFRSFAPAISIDGDDYAACASASAISWPGSSTTSRSAGWSATTSVGQPRSGAFFEEDRVDAVDVLADGVSARASHVKPARPGSATTHSRAARARSCMFPTAVLLVAVMTVMVRARHLDGLGLSSDEAVYIGQGSSLTRGGVHEVRAHPPLFGMLLRVISDGTREVRPRLVSVLLGVVAVIVAGFIARELAGRAAGIVAALTVATMPYHSDVTLSPSSRYPWPVWWPSGSCSSFWLAPADGPSSWGLPEGRSAWARCSRRRRRSVSCSGPRSRPGPGHG